MEDVFILFENPENFIVEAIAGAIILVTECMEGEKEMKSAAIFQL